MHGETGTENTGSNHTSFVNVYETKTKFNMFWLQIYVTARI
jgi:hypothetical protein